MANESGKYNEPPSSSSSSELVASISFSAK
jgi:hypothetical protein